MMFLQLQRAGNRRWTCSQLVSLAAHCLALYVLLRQPSPMFVQPSSVMRGMGGRGTQIVYLAAPSAGGSRPATPLVAPLPKPPRRPKSQPMPVKAEADENKYAAGQATRAGSPYGSLASGPAMGHEVRPALPVVFPDPAVARSEIPSGVQGDVVIEVTIDARGSIVQSKVLKTVGYGIEQKVLAALQNWRFTPATQDGVAIPSQQYVYFHFPS